MADGSYGEVSLTEINTDMAQMVHDYFSTLKSEAPMFYKWELIEIESGAVKFSKQIAVSDLPTMLKDRRYFAAMEAKKKPTTDQGQAVEAILQKIATERRRTVTKFGVQDRTPGEWLCILMEEVGEASQVIVEIDVLKTNKFTKKDYETELIQVAAVVVNALENLNRNK